MRTRSLATTAALAALLAPAAAPARPVPSLRAPHGAIVVVCAPDSAARVRRSRAGPRLLRACRHRRIQAAVDAAGRDATVLVLPGIYQERVFIRQAGLRLEGAGRRARDVVIRGGISARRADGLVLASLTAERAVGSDVSIAATDGFRVHRVVARWARDDGISAAASDHGLLDRVEGYANGGAGLRVGPGPRAGCGSGHGIEVRDANAYGNVVGYAGSSGDAAWVHRSRLAGNATGASVDPFAAGPATPRGCLRLEHDSIAANNAAAFYTPANAAFCRATPFARRRPGAVCPRLATPVGSGVVLRGINHALVRGNAIYGNARSGVRLFWSPAAARGQRDPARQFDTSNGNRFLDNRLGVHADGTPAPNGADVTWDGEGAGNCWSPNTGQAALPACPGGSLFSMGDAAAQAREAPCSAWDPVADPEPVGCDWPAVPT